MSSIPLPSSDELQQAVIGSLKANGGKATNTQMLNWTIENLRLSSEQLKLIRSGNRTEIEYRLAWARTRASKKGLIERSGPSTWTLVSSH